MSWIEEVASTGNASTTLGGVVTNATGGTNPTTTLSPAEVNM